MTPSSPNYPPLRRGGSASAASRGGVTHAHARSKRYHRDHPEARQADAEREEDLMARIAHIALKVNDLEQATKFYEEVFGFRQVKTGYARGHVSRHMTDGAIDLALMVYDSEAVDEARLSGPGPCI